MKQLVQISFFILLQLPVVAQQGITFQRLNTVNGLSYVGVNDMCTDKKGNLWIATGNGLNMFNGKTVDKYYASEHPQLQNNDVIHVTCDGSNRIWTLTAGGNVTMLDEKRQLHRAGLYINTKFVKTRWILNSQNNNIILFTEKGFYQLPENEKTFKKDSITINSFVYLTIKGFDTLLAKKYNQVFYYDDDHYLLVNGNEFYKINFRNRQVENKYPIRNCNALSKWGENELLFFDRLTKEIKAFNFLTGKISLPFKDLKDQRGKPVTAVFRFAEKINEHQYLLTTINDGIYIYDTRTGKILNYRHDVADPSSLANYSATTIAVGKDGWVFITCSANGISYFNTRSIIGEKQVFSDGKGNDYDGYIAGIATKDNNTFYAGTSSGLLQWKRNDNTTSFIDFTGSDGKLILSKQEVKSVIIDSNNNVWATSISNGIVIMDKNRRLLKHLKYDEKSSNSLKVKRPELLQMGPDGYVWVAGGNGISRIHTRTFKVDNLEGSTLATLDSFYSTSLFFADKENLWVGTNGQGAFHYNLATKKIRQYTTANGLVNDMLFSINSDKSGTIYIGGRGGLNILFKDGSIKTFTEKEGLLINRAEGLLLDKHNRMWIGNDIGLTCYNPADSSLRTFDERYGLSIYGFRVGSYFQMSGGEFIFGTPRGLQYFHPDSLFSKQLKLNIAVTKIETRNILSAITDNETFRLTPSDNQVTFYFGSVDYSMRLLTYYQYMLEGIDKDWIQTIDQNSVRYNSLPAGEYVFKVRISNDNKNWHEADNAVTVIIARPFYTTWWFKLLAVLVGLFIVAFVANYFRKKQLEKRRSLETELVINYFASQINSRYNTNELLWDVAKNLIGKLGFEDCMIYLWNDDRSILIQKAGYGSRGSMPAIKSKEGYDIPGGKGIVGAAVETRQAVLVNDTSKDKRYFTADGKIMLSELCVPLLHGNEVLGAINIEHHQKNFFTSKHLQMLSTIAVLCANQVQRILAEEEKQKATIELLKNKQKAAESRLQSLRLQMNPHFLFNSLNSVQQMILANEEMVATKYLSRFSKLLRTILVHSDKEFISLREEIEIIKLYVELESIRFKDAFRFIFYCDEAIDTEEVRIPTLLLQPFVENAIWHGLMHKETERVLQVKFTESDDRITCIIEDNGVGRKNATTRDGAEHVKQHTGKGIAVSIERLRALKAPDGREGSIEITDMKDEAGNALGTRVEINFPV
jgi:ligand-binding sensor domain-containing protein/putative methionine-R-sulfoxide reductase with GAF domain